MFETAGALAIVQPVLTLVGLVALPLLSALVALFLTPRRDGLVASMVAITCSVAMLGLAIVFSVRLALLSAGHVLVQHVAQLARIGQLDLSLDLSLDPRSATFSVVVGIAACASAIKTALSNRDKHTLATRHAWSGLLVAGAMLVCVGDGFAPILVGLGLVALAAWGLGRGDDAVAIATIGGNVAVVLGFLFLFWSLGGGFGPEGYDSDGLPRFVLVATKTESSAADRATLVMTTHAGALVSSDDADLPNEPVASPFSILVQPGVYTLRVQGGTASGDVLLPHVALVAGRTHVLTPYGPTASLRALDDQLAVSRPAAGGGAASVRAVLASRTIIGLHASAIILLFIVGGALVQVHALASRRGDAALAGLLEAVPAPYLALRLAGIFDPFALEGALVVLLGVGSAVILAARATCTGDIHQALRGVLAGAVSVSVAAAGLGEPTAVIIIAAAALLASCAALAALDVGRDPRWLGVACAATVGLLPFAGVSPGYISVVTAALGSAALGSVGWAIFSGTIAAGLTIACALGALAAFRVYDAMIRPANRESGRGAAVVIVLAVIALVGGTALGAGTTSFGGSIVPLARRLSGPASSAPAPQAMALVAVLLTLVAASGGVVLARRASMTRAAPEWLLVFGRPYAALAQAMRGLSIAGDFLVRAVVLTDRDVVDDIPNAALSLVVRPRRGPIERAEYGDGLKTAVVVAMVLVLAVIVLSAVVLT